MSCARISRIEAVIEVSLGLSAVQASAATCPGGVTEPKSNCRPVRIGPFSDQRSVTVIGACPAMLMIEGRETSGFQPSGVITSSGLSGFSRSIITS